MKEAKFSTEIIRSLRFYNIWAYKIPDAPITKAIMKLTRFTPEKPFDITACRNGQAIGIETKQFKKWKALGIYDFRPSQIKEMTDIVAHGGQAFVFLNIRIKKPHVNRLLIFDWKVWGARIANKSVTAKELMQRPFDKHFNHEDKVHFDLTDWIMFL